MATFHAAPLKMLPSQKLGKRYAALLRPTQTLIRRGGARAATEQRQQFVYCIRTLMMPLQRACGGVGEEEEEEAPAAFRIGWTDISVGWPGPTVLFCTL